MRRFRQTPARRAILGIVALACATAAPAQEQAMRKVRLITLDPGHFHAALVQKYMYADVEPLVHVYAPAAEELSEHLARIESFNSRTEQPTHWRQQVYRGPDFLEKMLTERAGNVVVISGNNARKTDYILRSIEAGLNVLADKPMAITPADFARLQQAFALAQAKGVLLYDIMTERFEITSILQRELARRADLFGVLERGSAAQPAIRNESVHYFSKRVAGAPLRRPQWFFDVRQQGEALVDVATHLVDLVQWQAFPEVALQPNDVQVTDARRWNTPLTREQFRAVTGAEHFPAYLHPDVQEGVLQVASNGELTYSLRGVHARVRAEWRFEAPAGSGDTHYSLMRGTKASLVIRQGEEQQYKPVLYIERAPGVDAAAHDAAMQAAMTSLQAAYPGVAVRRAGEAWAVSVPDRYNVGHEAHFAQVTESYLRYLRAGRLPEWEVPNMLTKISTIMQAFQLSRPK
jgi:predicted dehydrogenase